MSHRRNNSNIDINQIVVKSKSHKNNRNNNNINDIPSYAQQVVDNNGIPIYVWQDEYGYEHQAFVNDNPELKQYAHKVQKNTPNSRQYAQVVSQSKTGKNGSSNFASSSSYSFSSSSSFSR